MSRFARGFAPVFAFLSLALVSACVTSTDIAGGEGDDDYVDPTNVTTVNPNAGTHPVTGQAMPAQGAENENLQRDYDVLKGKLEESEWKARNLEAENKRLAEELAKAKAPPPAPSPVPSPIPVTGDLPNKTGAPLLWDLAQKDLKRGRFKEALVPLEEILKSYPKDAHAPFAMLAVPMVQYRLENFKEAALGFNQVIDRYPKRQETAIAWFGQGAAFFRLNQRDDSKLFYGETSKRYPKSEAAIQAKKYLARKKGGAPKDLFSVFPEWDAKVPK